jgi:hypothetical protein
VATVGRGNMVTPWQRTMARRLGGSGGLSSTTLAPTRVARGGDSPRIVLGRLG